MKIPTSSITPNKIQTTDRQTVKSVFVKKAYKVSNVTIPAVIKAAAKTISFPYCFDTAAQANETRIASQVTNVRRQM